MFKFKKGYPYRIAVHVIGAYPTQILVLVRNTTMVETHGEKLTMANVFGFQVKENVSIRNGQLIHLEQHSKNNAQVVLIFDDIQDFRG